MCSHPLSQTLGFWFTLNCVGYINAKKKVSPTIDEVEKVLHAGTLRLLRRLGKNCNVPETDLIYTWLDDNVMQSERSNLDKGY